MVKLAMYGVNDANHKSMQQASNLMVETKNGKETKDPKEKVTTTTPTLQSIRTFSEKLKDGVLAPMVSSQPREGEWERIRAIVDSGASVPAMHPNMGKAYPLQESAASRAGVEYECANKETLPNLGEKLMAVMTPEGTLRGYKSQCADVSQPISSVRTMVASQSAVCFGLGPAGDQHLIINRLTGEVNVIQDDGLNYIQELWVVPPDDVGKIQAQSGHDQRFAGQGR